MPESSEYPHYRNIHLLVRRDILRARLDKEMAEKVVVAIRSKGVELIMSAKIEGIRTEGEKNIPYLLPCSTSRDTTQHGFYIIYLE